MALSKNARIELRTTISHCPLVMIGFSTGVSGDPNAGTCSIRLTRDLQVVFTSSAGQTIRGFSDGAGSTMDGGRRVDDGDTGMPGAAVWVADELSGRPSSATEVEGVIRDIKIPMLLGMHSACTFPRNLRTRPGLKVLEAGEQRPLFPSVSDAKWTPRDFSRSDGAAKLACAKVGVVGDGRVPVVELFRLGRGGRGGSPSKSNTPIH